MEIDKEKLIKKLEELGAEFKGDKVMNMLEILDLSKDKVTTLDVDSVYKKYGSDLKDIKVLKF